MPIAFSISGFSAASWIDAACLGVVVFCVGWDALRGFSATLAQIVALVAAFKLLFFVYPHIASVLPQGGVAALAAGFAAALAVGFVAYLALRFLIAKVAHVVLIAPIDNILGAATGFAKALLLIFLAFSLVALVCGSSYSSTAFAKSRTGTRVMPAVERLLAPSGGKMPFSLRGGR